MEEHNPSHLENIPRLNRIAGQIEGIKKNDRRRALLSRYPQPAAGGAFCCQGGGRQYSAKASPALRRPSFADEAVREEKIEELKRLFDRYGD